MGCCAREIPGAYVPSLYEVSYNDDGTVDQVSPKEEGVPEVVARRIIADLDSAPMPVHPVVPFVDTVHDRLSVEMPCAMPARRTLMNVPPAARAASVSRIRSIFLSRPTIRRGP